MLMPLIMKQLGRRVAEWRRNSLLDKGLKVILVKSKAMFGSSGGKMIVNSGNLSCVVCRKEVHANSVKYTLCKRWIHGRCSGVRGDLSLVVDSFR